jgi:hypothetical protein
MKTYPTRSDDGRLYAFEVENAYIGSRKIAGILKGISGVTDVRVRRPFTSPSDARVFFRYQGNDYVVWEPYGDSSRYWFGPEGEENTSLSIDSIESAFKDYKLPFTRKIVGDLVSLNFKSLFGIGNEASMRK